MPLDMNALANAIKVNIEEQARNVDYHSYPAEELEEMIKQLEAKLAFAKTALEARAAADATGTDGADGKKKEAPKLVAAKAEKGDWPELPWGVAGKQDGQKIADYITKNMQERIMIIDGAMGTTVQQYKFSEEDFRGEMFKDHPATQELKGNNDLLVFTQPDTIREIHRRYFECGADICETNTFSGTVIAQADYAMEHVVYEMNKIACELAVDAAREITAKQPHRPRLVAGAIGPTNRTLSISPSVEDSGYRNCTWDEVVEAYKTQVAGLVDGGAHIILVETIFDSLNAKAALYAIDEYYEESGCPRLPVMVSGTIVDMSGRTLSGQTTEAFYVSMAHAKPICIGLNCALGADQMLPFMQALSDVAECFVHSYPNAGLPNAMGG